MEDKSAAPCNTSGTESLLGTAAALPSFPVSQAFVEVLVEAYEKGALQDSLRALGRARRAGKEKEEMKAREGEDLNQADTTDDACTAEKLHIHPEEDEMHAPPNSFQPLLALAEALQRISQKAKAAAEAAAEAAAAEAAAATAEGDENPEDVEQQPDPTEAEMQATDSNP
ncbi:hypothetical protein Emed_005300 [Eimeria media]